VICASCQAENPAAAKFCTSCGVVLARACAACGTPHLEGARFCAECGRPLSAAKAPPSPPPEAQSVGERRQLSVLFCDLVGSTALGERLDPEDLRELVAAYQAVCETAVRRFDGHVAQYLGDGVLVYFGYPVAHDNSAESAVRAGLAIQEGLVGLNAERGLSLAARVGLHTGEVVIGEMGGGAHRERLALGGTTNVAARLQGLAEPGAVVISEATLRLVSGLFVTQALGTPELKGIDGKLAVHAVLRGTGVRSRLEAATSLSRLVGRDHELGLLAARFEQVCEGAGQVVIVRGDAGVGKSRLLRSFRERMAESPHTELSAQCSSYDADNAFHPVVDILREGFAFGPSETTERKIDLLERAFVFPGVDLAETVPFLASLLAVPQSPRFPLLDMAPELQRSKTLEALVSVALGVCELQPLLFVVEDVHWADPSTLEFISLLADRLAGSRVLLLLTARLEFEPPKSFQGSRTSTIALSRLSARESASLVHAVAGREMPEAVVDEIVGRADGVPLYVEELTRAVLDGGLLEARGDGFVLTGSVEDLGIPATLQDSLMARLDRLSSTKAVAQVAAALGRDFDYALIEAVAPLDVPSLRTALAQLVAAEVLTQRGALPGASFSFRHSLMVDIAHQSQLLSTRRELHARIADAIESRFPERAQERPEEMVRHCIQAGLAAKAVEYSDRAASRARARFAHREAAEHFRRALEQLAQLPPAAERDTREIALQLGLGNERTSLHGLNDPRTLAAYARVRALNDGLGEGPQQLPGWIGIATHAMQASTFPQLIEAGLNILRIAEPLPVPPLHALGHLLSGIGAMTTSAVDAQRHLEQAVEIAVAHEIPPQTPYDPDLEVAARSTLETSFMFQCRFDDYLEQERLCLERARRLGHATSLALALTMGSAASQMGGDAEKTLRLAQEGYELSRERGFTTWRWQNLLRVGWAKLVLGKPGGAQDLAAARAGLAGLGSLSSEGVQELFAAQGLMEVGDFAEAEACCDRAERLLKERGESGLTATVWLRRGQLRRREGRTDEAIPLLRKAADSGIVNLEARLELAQLHFERGERDEARRALAPALAGVRGGAELPIVRRARELRAALGIADA
jgi:class 3 adenylate cyclase/tetratricopeptide (TPR) repeat protein